MIRNRMTTIAGWLIAAVLAGGLLPWSTSAQSVISNPALDGVYNGTFTGDQGPAKFKLTITRQDNNGYQVGAVLTLYLPEGSRTNAYTCDLDGNFISRGGFLQLRRTKWETAAPTVIELLGINGSFNQTGGNGAGLVSGIIGGARAYKFEAIRDVAESPAVVAAPPASRPTAAERRAAPPPSPQQHAGAPQGAEVNGVYVGTYGSNPDDNVAAKLYVKYIADGSVNGTLSGLFSFDVPPSYGAKPITYTYKLTGTYAVGTIDFWSGKPLGKPPPDAYALKSLRPSFTVDKWPNINPDKISGPVVGNNNRAGNTFAAVRDKAELTNLDSLMAAQASAAESEVNNTAPVAAPAAAPAARPTIEGVFNGTYTRSNEPPAKFKLTMTHTRYDGAVSGVHSLTGIATIYLPTDSGTKAYTYSLTGSEDAGGQFALTVYDWETVPPKDFQNFRGMGFAGTFLFNETQHRARIISRPTHDRFFIPTFEATWDATESADINRTIAAQKAVRNADQAVALNARAEAMKNAPPLRLASKKLVRKSQTYWNAYQGDFIRQIFDGGFADDVYDDWSFQEMFTMYVELFSKNCTANLPANYHTIKIITTTYRDGYVVGKPETKTLNIDPRFIPKYCEFSGVEPDPGTAEASDLEAKNARIFRRVMQAGTPAGRSSNGDIFARLRVAFAHPTDVPRDMNKFFATETGSSAAMRQFGENLLRGATGEPSLQEADAKIDGAAAETDTDIPPGRFTHLIDAANVFCRDPANANYRSRYETAFYMLLAEKYRGVMTPEEEYYYANDFVGRFRDQIMGTRANSTDPAWPRLHPAVEECMKEMGR